jgi:teichuronic acid biosynthesis glycosyltransferase TuaG
MARVSVIIPAFDAEEYLEEALRSVQSQTYHDWEIVVCDDCSTDRTAERARSFGNRVTLVCTETNSGPAVARNLAIQHSSGGLLAFLDADDYWLPAYLERLVSLHDSAEAARANVGIVACNASLLHADRIRPETYMDIVRFPREVTLHRLLRANPFASLLTPRRVVDEVGGFCPELARAQDFDLWIRIVELGYRVLATREVLAVRRIHSQSWSSNVGVMAQYSQETYRRALERGNLPPRERRVARRELRHARLIERAVSEDGLSYLRALRALPLLLLVVAEHPRAWRSLPRKLARGKQFFAPVPPLRPAPARRSDGSAAAAPQAMTR